MIYGASSANMTNIGGIIHSASSKSRIRLLQHLGGAMPWSLEVGDASILDVSCVLRVVEADAVWSALPCFALCIRCISRFVILGTDCKFLAECGLQGSNGKWIMVLLGSRRNWSSGESDISFGAPLRFRVEMRRPIGDHLIWVGWSTTYPIWRVASVVWSTFHIMRSFYN